MSPTRSRVAVADGAPVEGVAPVGHERLERLLESLGCVHGQVAELEAVAQEHVEAVDVDAVVGVTVGEHDRGEVLGRDVLLQVAERAVRRSRSRSRCRPTAAGSRCTARRWARRTTPSTPGRSVPSNAPAPAGRPSCEVDPHRSPLHASTDSTSGPRKRTPRVRKVSTGPLVRKTCRGSPPASGVAPGCFLRSLLGLQARVARASSAPRTRSRRRSTPAPRRGP